MPPRVPGSALRVLSAVGLAAVAVVIATARAADSPASEPLKQAAAQCRLPLFKSYLSALSPLAPQAKAALRVAQDLASDAGQGVDSAARFVHYSVPSMSNSKRTMHSYPQDGTLAGPVRLVAAKGEFESASFVLYAFADAAKVELTVSDLVGKAGKLPAAAVSVKVVKVWYQAGTAWYSYFADSTGRELVPELLLNDERLVRADQATRDNYLRVDYPPPRGPEYTWISNPVTIDVPFNDHREPVADARTLQPFTLTAGEFKQLWVTVEAPKDAEGLYRGTMDIRLDGKAAASIPLVVRILPFALPDPKTNYDLTREYYTSIYNHSNLAEYTKKNGGNLEQAKARLFNEYVDMRQHNVLYPMVRDINLGEDALLAAQMEIYRQAGLHTDAIFGAVPALPPYGWMTSPEVTKNPIAQQPMPEELIKRIDAGYELMTKILGHSNIYCFGWDEPGMALLTAQRKPWQYLQDKGLKTYSTAHDGHLTFGGYNEDFVNYGGHYDKATSDKWHAFGGRITSYAAPHTGPENPDFVRRTHGLDLYKANCDGTNNYVLNENGWNDFLGVEYNFRAFNWIYPGREKPIDTIEWEGFREAIDDVRYATLLQQRARQAMASGKTERVYQGRMALQWLALLDAASCDLNAARREMIAYILKLDVVN